ncbi:MAG: choice-of-anchor tandem repeat NxxGxxAF-containing protein [Planctomycetota bacterium]
MHAPHQGHLLSALAIACSVGMADGQPEFRTVALSEAEAPGVALPTVFNFFFNPSIGSDGTVSFLGAVNTPSPTNEGIWVEAGSGLVLAAREGDPAPGLSAGVVIEALDIAIRAGASTGAFQARIGGAGISTGNDIVLLGEGPAGTFGVLAREGDPAPGVGGGLFSAFVGFPAINAAAQRAFVGNLLVGTGGVTAANQGGIWTDRSGSLALLVRSGNPAPGAGAGVDFATFDADLAINPSGTIAFAATLTGSSVNTDNDSSIWRDSGSGPELVVREGAQVPGEPAGVVYTQVETRPGLDADGRVVFWAEIDGPGIDDTNDSGIWAAPLGTVPSPVVREGQPAPGTPSGVVFGDIGLNPSVAAGAGVAFVAELAGPSILPGNDSGIWISRDGGTTELLAREGDPAPGVGGGGVYEAFFNNPALSSTGRTVFGAGLTGGAVTNDDDNGLWTVDASGTATLIIRDGDTIDVDDDPVAVDERTVAFSVCERGRGSEDGRNACLNADAELTLRLGLEDDGGFGSGIFVIRLEQDDCPGDVNGDGTVSDSDFFAWVTAFVADPRSPEQEAACDVNRSGNCSDSDFFAWVTIFINGC